jgi:hypothetical protein
MRCPAACRAAINGSSLSSKLAWCGRESLQSFDSIPSAGGPSSGHTEDVRELARHSVDLGLLHIAKWPQDIKPPRGIWGGSTLIRVREGYGHSGIVFIRTGELEGQRGHRMPELLCAGGKLGQVREGNRES